ncbi:MAG: glycosyltransferase 87 family protein [Terracidiphilus sp.]
MTRERRIGLFLVLFSTTISILWGFALSRANSGGMADFQAVYYGARCLIQHKDPYIETEFLRVYLADGGQFPPDPAVSNLLRRAIPVCINLPTALLLTLPFAILAWGPAHLLWMTLIAGCLVLASFLIWDLAGAYSQGVSLFLICFVLANSEVLISSGNLAGIAIGLCIAAVWCFMKDRFVVAGILCLAVGLVIKPHDVGLVWLFFLLGGASYRKRALQTLAFALVLCLPAILWVSHVAPNWMQELHSNLLATSAHGDIRDPGPTSSGIHEVEVVIDLQSVISIFRDDPRIYDPASYLACGTLLLVWSAQTLISRDSRPRDWLALAVIVPLTMLASYHRPYDAKLLLLTIPACAMLWYEGGAIGRIALVINTAAIVFTGDIPMALLLLVSNRLHVGTSGFLGKIQTVMLLRPATLILLAMTVFYLWAYLRRTSGSFELAKPKVAERV